MKTKCLLAALIVLLAGFNAKADIIGWDCWDDGDGALVKNSATWDDPTYTMAVNATQYWGPGHMLGYFTTDTPTDPTIWIRNTVLNDATLPPLSWTDFHINLFMTSPFTIGAAATMPGWVVSNITPPVLVGSEWVGTVDYLDVGGPDPINIGDWGEFDAQVSFLGSINFRLEMIPTPEPATLSLLALAGTALLRRRR